jgi:hypothetical protein
MLPLWSILEVVVKTLLQWPITVLQQPLQQVKCTVKTEHTISTSDKLDTCQHLMLNPSGQQEVHLTLHTPLKLLLMQLLKLHGTLMLLFLRRMPRWMPLPQPSLHQKLQLFHHFQTCHGLHQLTVDILNKLHSKMLLC